MTDTPKPVEINLHQKSRVLEISYSDGERFELSYEFLRVHSPSAEVQGHGPGQGVLQIGKEDAMITHIEPVGHYAIQPTFDDGHDTGIYSWETLYDMGKNRDSYWQAYVSDLGLDTREGEVTWGRSDKMRLSLGFDSQQQVRNNTGYTPFTGKDDFSPNALNMKLCAANF